MSTPDIPDRAEWTKTDRDMLAQLRATNESLPLDAPRALLSVRLSVLTDDTTSPVRQELDLWRKANDKGYRVIGVADDLNVSATKIPPWERKKLGKWLVDRTPEFDAILFWKVDRFVRSLNDLNVMIRWAKEYQKNIVSHEDPIDLDTVMGQIMAQLIAGIAQIEAANIKTRVTSTWNYAKTQEDWIVGTYVYGYLSMRGSETNGYVALEGRNPAKKTLVIDPLHGAAIMRAREMIVNEGLNLTDTVKHLIKEGLATWSLNASSLKQRLYNPAILGHRVEEIPGPRAPGKSHIRSRSILNEKGEPIIVGPPILTEDEFAELHAVLDRQARNPTVRQSGGRTQFLGVLICKGCGKRLTEQHNSPRGSAGKAYSYLRCQGKGTCKGGGPGVRPEAVYGAVVEAVLQRLGDEPVTIREYARGEETRKEIERLETSIDYYMTGLAPGGQFTRTEFTRENAQRIMDGLINELSTIDRDKAQDQWTFTSTGKTYREHWEEGGLEAMADDLFRAGITIEVERIAEGSKRFVNMTLKMPEDVRGRLAIKDDPFASPVISKKLV